MPQTGIWIEGKPFRSANRYCVPIFFDRCANEGSAIVDRDSDESHGMGEPIAMETNAKSFRDRLTNWILEKKR
jgi:hypothetical protein